MATQEDKFVERLRGALGSVLEKEADMFDYVKSLAPERLQGAIGLALNPATKPRRDLAKALVSQTPLERNVRAVANTAEQVLQQNFSVPQDVATRANTLVEGLADTTQATARSFAGAGPNIAADAGRALGQAMPQAPQLAPKPAPAPSPMAPTTAPVAAAPTAPAAAQPDETDVRFFEYAHDPNQKWGGFNPQSQVDQQKMAVIKQLRAQNPKASPQQIALQAYKIQYGQ